MQVRLVVEFYSRTIQTSGIEYITHAFGLVFPSDRVFSAQETGCYEYAHRVQWNTKLVYVVYNVSLSSPTTICNL